MKTLLLISCVFLCLVSYAQVISKSDTTIALKTDEYNNFKPSSHVTQSRTMALDSAENANLSAQGKTSLVKFNYFAIAGKADSLYQKREYARAANLYAAAFKKNNDEGQVKHRYNLACCFAILNQADSSFLQLYRIAKKGNYYNYIQLESEKCFELLYVDKRWQPLVKLVKKMPIKLVVN